MTYTAKTGETFRYKSDAVKWVLKNDAEIAAWYRDEHGVNEDWVDNLNASNCSTYGMGAPGDTCDMILADAGVKSQ